MVLPVSKVADMETRLGPGGRYVDPVFQHSQRHNVGFVRDLVKVGSIGFVEDAVEKRWLFFCCQEKLVLRDSLLMCVQAKPTFFEASIWAAAHK